MPEENTALEYTFDKAKKFTSKVLELFKRDSLDNAITKAIEYQESSRLEGERVRVFIPCNPNSLTSGIFQDFLKQPEREDYKLINGEKPNGPAIFGTLEEGQNGLHENGSPYKGFLVYDHGAEVIVDLIDRRGISLMNPIEKRMYTSNLEEKIGEPIGWFDG